MIDHRPLMSGIVLAAVLAASQSPAGSLTGWRGDNTGVYPDAQPPVSWSTSSNVVWKAKLPSWSNASPLILGDKLFVCSEPATLVCVALKDGAILWTRTNVYADILSPEETAKAKADSVKAEGLLAQIKPLREDTRKNAEALKKTPDDAALKTKKDELKNQLAPLEGELKRYSTYSLPATHEANGFSTPTPTTDGKVVYALFGNGVAACYDVDGNRKWARLVEKPTQGWGHSGSPVFVDGKLIVHVLKVTALDPSNGSTLWQTDSGSSWGSPVQTRIGDVGIIVTPGGDIIRVSDGRKLAQKVSGLAYCAPVVQNGIVYFVQRGGKAIRLPAAAADAIQPETVWETKPKDDRYYASPVVQDGLIYAVTQHGDWSVIDAANGQIVYEHKLGLEGTVYPSVTLAGGLLFVSSDNGKTVILQPGREYKEIARNSLEAFRSCPVFVGQRAYVRGHDSLWCLGK